MSVTRKGQLRRIRREFAALRSREVREWTRKHNWETRREVERTLKRLGGRTRG